MLKEYMPLFQSVIKKIPRSYYAIDYYKTNMLKSEYNFISDNIASCNHKDISLLFIF